MSSQWYRRQTRGGFAWSICVFVLAQSVSPLAASDWPGFRGATADGLVAESTALTQLESFHLAQAWKVPLGSGYSGLAVANGRLIAMYSDGTNDVTASFDTATGKKQWQYTIEETYVGHDGSHTGPLSTPTIGFGMVFGLSPRGRLFALDAASGEQRWSVDLVKEFESKKPHYGFTTSPIIAEGVLVVEVGGTETAVAGFDPLTGKRLWAACEDSVQYQSPILWHSPENQRIVIATGDKKLTAMAPRDGRVLWTYEHGGAGAQGVASLVPVPAGGGNFFLAFKDETSTVVELTPDDGAVQAKTRWEDRAIRKSYNVPVYQDGYVYAYSTRFLTCVDAATGEAKWRSREPGDGFLILVDGHLVIVTKEGSLHVAKATPDGYEPLADLKLGDDLIWTPPAFADGSIFVRSMGELTRVDIRSGAEPADKTPAAQTTVAGTMFERFLEEVQAASDKKAVIDRFMAAQKSFPVIEGSDLVHFVYRGDATDVAVAGDLFGARQERAMTHIPGTDLFYLTARLEPDARTTYLFLKDYQGTIDPLNKRTTTTTIYKDEMEMSFAGAEMEMSWVAMPKWPEPDHLAASETGPKGRLEHHEIDSEPLEKKVTLDVYLPAGYDKGTNRLPVAYVHDGKNAMERGRWVTTLDNVLGRRVDPVIVVFLSTEARAMGPQYGQMFAREVVPFIDETYRTIAAPQGRASIGTGFAAFAALACTVGEPGVVGKLGTQSMFMFGSMKAGIDPYLKTAREHPLTIYQDWGTYELRNPHEAWDLGQTNRDFNKELREKGYEPLGGEVHDGTGWSSWRNRTDKLLAALFPLGSSTR